MKRAEHQAHFNRAKGVPESFLPADLKAWHGDSMPTKDTPDPRPDARIRITLGIVGTQSDEVLPPRFPTQHALTHCKTCRLLADLPGAEHFALLWPWPESVARPVARLVVAEQVRGGLPQPGIEARQRAVAHAKSSPSTAST